MASAEGVRAGKAFVEVNAKDNTKGGLSAIERRLRSFGKAAMGIGAGFLGAGAAILGPLALVAKMTADIGRDIKKTAADTGQTIEQVGALKGFSAEQSRDAVGVSDAYDQLTQSLKQVVVTLGGSLLPLWQEYGLAILDNIAAVGEFIKRNKTLIAIVVAVGVGLAVAGVALIAIGAAATGAAAAIALLKVAIAAIGAVIGFLTSPIGIVVALVAALAAGLVYLFAKSEVGKQILAELGEYFRALWERAKETFGGIKAAIETGDWALAMRIAWVALKAEFLRVVGEIAVAFGNLFNKLNQMWKDWITKLVGDPAFRLVLRVLAIKGGGGSTNMLAASTKLPMIDTEALRSGFDAKIQGLDLERKALINQAQENRDRKRQAVPAPPELKAMASYTRGSFSGSAIAQSLGAGDKIADKIAKNTELTAKGVAQLVEQGGRVMEFA